MTTTTQNPIRVSTVSRRTLGRDENEDYTTVDTVVVLYRGDEGPRKCVRIKIEVENWYGDHTVDSMIETAREVAGEIYDLAGGRECEERRLEQTRLLIEESRR